MRYMSKEERDKEPWRGRGGSTKVFREVISMEVGKILFIEPEDWQRKHPPTTIVRYIEKKYGRKYYTLRHAANKGWAVERLK
jgi:hypothetical protein